MFFLEKTPFNIHVKYMLFTCKSNVRHLLSHRVYFSKGLCVIDETFQVVVIYRFIVLQLYSEDRC